MRILDLAALLFSVVGVLLAFFAYAGPLGNTGVDGSTGALLALIGAVATTIGIAIILSRPDVRGRTALSILIVLAAILTALAAFFLMQFALTIAMVLALVGYFLARSLNHRRRAA